MNTRIAQWENMTQADPNDDMGWFSLGNAYKDAARFEDAAKAFGRAIEINPGMSRAFQLRGQVLIQLGQNDVAAELLTRGYVIASERGDVMPQRAMGSLLEKIGHPVPQVKAAVEAAAPTPANAIMDRKSGQMGNRLPDAPMRGPTGKFIFDHFSNETWQQWIRQGTKVINELRLDFSNETHHKTYDHHMMEWLGFTQEDVDEYAKQTASKS